MKKVLVFTFVCLLSVASFAGSGDDNKLKSISGTVVDADLELMIGARVEIVELEKTVYTDFDGNFVLNGLKPGAYTLKVSHVSYQTKEASIYTVQVDDSQKLDIQLKSK